MSAAALSDLGFLALCAKGLCLQRGGRVLFEALDFTLKPGEVLMLTGPNGSGKSSLLRAVIGLAPLSAGGCVLSMRGPMGEPVNSPLSASECRGLALYQGHAAAVKGELSALENLTLSSALDAAPAGRPIGSSSVGPRATPIAESELMRALSVVGLRRQHAIEARRLSQGQRQRLQLARFALALESAARPVWLMDEPSAALDEAGTQVLQELLSAHLQRGGAALIATHLSLTVPAGQVHGLALQDWAPARVRPDALTSAVPA